MKTLLFSVYDSKVGAFMQPFFSPSQRDALDAFSMAANDPKTALNKHPGDFSLYQIGEFDDQTGTVKSITPINLGLAIALKKELNSNQLQTAQ